MIIEQLQLTDVKGVVTPGDRVAGTDDDEAPLMGDQASLFRSVAARSNYLAQDRPDIAYAVKEICRKMSTPTV